MSDFLSHLMNPDFPFLRYALYIALLASISFGIIGSFVVVRRIGSIAGAISHSVLGGIGAALYAATVLDIPWLLPIHGAIAAALLSALIIGFVSQRIHEREDTVIAAVWSIGMAIGVLFLAKTPGYIDPMSYLFGNILLISPSDLWTIAGLDVLIIALVLLTYQKLVALSFDQEFARLQGINVELYSMLMLCLTALTVVLLVTIVGIVMVIALLILPPAIAGFFTRRLSSMIFLSIVLSIVFNTTGLFVSFQFDLPTGPTIIAITGATYLGIVSLHWYKQAIFK